MDHCRVKMPAANNKEWIKLDEDVDRSLEAITKGNIDQNLQIMSILIINIGAEHFGIQEDHGASQ